MVTFTLEIPAEDWAQTPRAAESSPTAVRCSIQKGV